MGRDILVDGYNVIKRDVSLHSLGTKNLAAARQLLINQLANRYRHTPHQVIVVFDGNEMSERTTQDHRVRIIYSQSGETADNVIARLATTAKAAGREVELYSDDAEVQQAVARQGGTVHTSAQLTNHLNAAPSNLAQLSHHRQLVRRQYGLDPTHKYVQDDDESQPASSTGRKKKKTSRHRR